MFFYTREEVIKMTPQWTGERLEDGRPKVPASVLERMRKLTLEEVSHIQQIINDIRKTKLRH